MRKLATIRKIDIIKPIKDADAIECAILGGWPVVIRKGEYQEGDLVIYCSIDSWVPTSIAPFLSKGKEPSVYEGVSGERLRTIRLKKQLSQGLLLPISIVDNITVAVGDDVTDFLGIIKWEAPLSAQLSGVAKGLFPTTICKTDQERLQNLSSELAEWQTEDLTWEITEKCEGSSFTAYMLNNEFGVCSRNLELKDTAGNTLWDIAKQLQLKEKLTIVGRNIAVQAELIGPGIQSNIYKLVKHQLAVFDIFDIDTQQYLLAEPRIAIINQLGLTAAPIIDAKFSLKGQTMNQLLEFADGSSIIGITKCNREGLVFKCNEQAVSFKVISNQYLIKEK